MGFNQHIWGFLEIGFPQVAMGFNTEPSPSDLDDSGVPPFFRKPPDGGFDRQEWICDWDMYGNE